MDEKYIKSLVNRFEYFLGKKITDLTDEEIYEFIHLRNEIQASPDVEDAINEIWNALTESIACFIDSYEDLLKRVLNKK